MYPSGSVNLELPDFNSLDVLKQWVLPEIITNYPDKNVIFRFQHLSSLKLWGFMIDMSPKITELNQSFSFYKDDPDLDIACRKACEEAIGVKE